MSKSKVLLSSFRKSHRSTYTEIGRFMKKTLYILLSLFIVTQLASCTKKTVSKKSSSSSNSTNSGNGTNVDTGTGDEDDGSSTATYYILDNITLIGGETTSSKNYYPNGAVMWSSATKISSADQAIFLTNSRFNVRVKAENVASRTSTDANGRTCTESFMSYSKLNITLCLRSSAGSCVRTHTFSDVPVGSYSGKYAFNLNGLVTSDPLVLEVLSVTSDQQCSFYKQQGYSESDVPHACPYMKVSYTHCSVMDIQFATDYTEDLP